ncbi:unnamed protein product [Candidula unifasciata]|uniref:K Homology domain-containing protein n=1 Tax=Candidula unifasciata TaxID=100452 RepID=A0A8S3YVV0_9EUPU|nr:unnamed protein product [Candidula unifasciata]
MLYKIDHCVSTFANFIIHMKMMQEVSVDKAKEELRTIEIEPNHDTAPAISCSGKVVEPYSNFGQDLSGSDDDEASEVDSFILEDDSEQGLEASKFLLAAESDGQGIQTVDPQTQARLEALLEAAGISKLSSKDGKALSDPEVLRTLTSSVSSALDEAAQALHRMRDTQGQLPSGDGMHMDANGESESIGHRSGSGNVADASEEGESLLSLACSAGYYELAQVLLTMKANVEDRGIKGDCTPLMEAASGGHVDIVRLLLLHHADINAQSSAGNTPLHYGACGGFKDVVLELVMNGANVEIHNENGHTPLMEAASAGHVEVAKILLEHGAGINTHSNEFKESALTLACYKGHLEMVKFLLEAGADQEHKTDEMHTALMEASMDGHVEVARLLLDSGAQVNMPADSFESPLTLAACGGHLELAGLLIERGANIEEVNDEGYTPLMEAAREGHEDMVALLLSQGADINAQTEETQETALTLACCGGFLEVADFLLRSGAHIELGCSTPLMEAAQEGHLELVSFLLQSGANVEAQTGTGDTALTYACENGHTDVAEALLECGANLEHESEGGRTPLMKAARAGHLCTVQFLISKGADVNRATTSNDHTVLSLASAGGHLAVVELLLQHGADCNHKLKDGSTMVIEAAKGGHTQVVKLLLEWPNRYLVHSATDQLAHLCVNDVPYEEPRVPVQGLANIVPPSEPDSQIPLASAIHTKTVELSRQNLQKNLTKRLNGGQVDTKGGNKFCNPENFQQFFSDAGLISDRAIDKEENLCTNQPTKEEQIQRKQQILEELKKVEQELQDKAQAHLLHSTQLELEEHHQQQIQTKLRQASTSFPTASPFGPANAVVASAGLGAVSKAEQLAKQNEEIAKLLELPSHTIGLIDPHNLDQLDISKILAWNEENCAEASCPEACLQTVQAHLQQQQQQQSQLQRTAPPPPPLTAAVVPTSPGVSPVADTRGGGGGGGKILGGKRNGSNKQVRTSKNSQPLQQSPPPPPPPPPPLSVHSPKGSPMLPLVSQQPTLAQNQPIVFHTDHNGVSQSVDSSQILALNSASQVMLDPLQCQQHQSLAQQVHLQQQQQQMLTAQQQMLAYPQLIPQQQQDQLLHQMLNQSNLQHQLQLQQVQCGQQFLQGVASTQVTAAHTAQLSQQLLQQQLKPPSTSGTYSTPPVNKSQVRKQQRVAQTAQQTVIQQNAIVNVDGSYPSPGILGTAMNSLYSSVDVDSQTESNHDTALTLACAGGHAELVTLLLAKGADIEHRDKKGFTPLILAATAGHVDVVEILLDHNADIEAQSERTKDTPLSLACSGGRYEVVELLLNRGANKEHRNVSDYTPLSLAASGGYVNIIRLLLNHNAEINSRTGSKLGISPLMLAAMNGHTAAVKLLLDQGSDINAQIETNRNTALTLACFQGRHEVVSLLVDRKANIEHRAKTGLTPLMEAASGGYVEVGRVLLDKGADVNAPPVPSSRDTALTIAADKGHYRFVELLLHRGAAVDVKNKKGNSPLWLACNGGHSDVVSLLVQAEADIDSQDNRKVSCLMAAFRRGHIKVVKWMVKKVTQFPSENEIKRYIATITDKELQKKCNQCADIIVAAKERQAAEANKNADSLLEEIQQEKEQAALKAELASKRRERRRERKRKGKQRDEKNEKDKDSGKNSSPEPDGESNSKKDDDDEDEDEEDDSNSEPPMIAAPLTVKPDPVKCSKVKNRTSAPNKCQTSPENQQPARVLPLMTSSVAVTSATTTASTASGPSPAAARASRDSRKKQQKAARESRCEGSDQDRGLRNVKAELSKKEVTQALQVKVVKVTTAAELLVSAAGITSRPATSVVTTSPTQVIYVTHTPKVASTSVNTNNPVSQPLPPVVGYTNSKDNPTSVAVNGGAARSRPKKSTDMIKQSSTTGIGDLDDFGVIPTTVLKNIDKINGTAPGTKKLSDSKKDWIDEYSKYFDKNMVNRLTSSAPSPRKGQKKEDGWKEVIRKNVSKKLSVPGNVISRLIGKGGCNINAIRELSGAHVEIEKSKGAAERTVTIRGAPEAIRQANSLINAMIEEPDKDVSELLTRANKGQKPAPEKPASQKVPVAITDFAIGTFIIPTTSMHTSSNTTVKSPGQSKSGKQNGSQFSSQANSAVNTMGPTIGAWQNPVPGQALPASPRRSPQKQVTPSSSVIGARSSAMENAEKASARQLMFGMEPGKRPRSPVSVMSSSSAPMNFTTTATSSSRGVVCTPLPNQTMSKPHDQQRLQNQIKPAMPAGIPAATSAVRFSRPLSSAGPRMEGLPLPIVTSGSSSHLDRSNQAGNCTPSSQPTSGEYSPFNNGLFTNFMPKKEEPTDKMDFASVAAAGVVTTSPSPQTTTNPSPSTSSNTINDIDPVLQAKAPGYKMPQGNSPPYRPDMNASMGGYQMSPVGSSVTSSVHGLSNINSSMRPLAPVATLMDDFQINQMLHYQYLNQQMSENCSPMLQNALMRMDIGTRGLPMIPGVFHHQGMSGMPLQQLPQKEEYSKPHRPMTLPEIKGGLNPNAPEFQLPGTGPPMMNGFDRHSGSSMGGMVRMNMADVGGRSAMGPLANLEGPIQNSGPNPGHMPPIMHPDMLGGPSVQYLLHQQHPPGSGLVATDNGGSPQLVAGQMTSSLSSIPHPHSSAQGMMGPPGLSPGGGGIPNFLPQSQPQRAHTSLQNLAGVRPSSAPSVQPVDPGIMSAPRSGSPLSARTPPLDHGKLIQPIGGERRKGTGRPGPVPNAGSYSNLWSFGDSTAYSPKWSTSGSIRANPVPSAVMTAPGVSGGNMVYPGMPDADNEVLDYGLQSHVPFNDTGMPGGDGDHNSMGQPPAMMVPAMYSNGPYPMAPMFPPKGIVGDSHTPPLWNPALTLVPSGQGDNERWQSWSQ